MSDPSGFDLPDPARLQGEALPAAEATASAAGGALARHHDRLMRLPGVVMLGEGQDASGAPAIVIGVRAAGDLARLPAAIDGVPVVGLVTGEVSIQPRPR
jgi:hypothetical protein